MRDVLPAFYRPSEDELRALWRDCLFVLDTNVLLNLYRYPQQARDDLIKTLMSLSNRLWVPFQVALEFQRNRPSVIAEQKKRFREVRALVEGVVTNLENEFAQLQLRKRHALINPDDLIRNIEPAIDRFLSELKELERNQGDVHEVDLLRNEIDRLLAGRVGPAPTRSEIESINNEGEERYEVNLPPGYIDKSKEVSKASTYSYGGVTYQKKFGDLVLWKQLLAHVKCSKVKSVIFLTDDDKEDWWWIIESVGKKKLGPRPELVEELHREANVKGFYMYNSEQFLEYARRYLEAEISDVSIKQVGDIASLFSETATRDLALRHEAIEHAVAEWLIGQSPYTRIVYLDGARRYLAIEPFGSDEKIGLEVSSIRSQRQLIQKLRQRLERIAYDLSDGDISRFELVFVTNSVPDEVWLLDLIDRSKLHIPPGVRVTLGRVVSVPGDADELKFIPLDIRLPNEARPD